MISICLFPRTASASQTEGITTGTIIVSAPTASNAEGTVTYSLTDAEHKFAVNSSTGAVTLANNLDFETKTAHLYLTASMAYHNVADFHPKRYRRGPGQFNNLFSEYNAE